jgi:hypothetical protein
MTPLADMPSVDRYSVWLRGAIAQILAEHPAHIGY